SCYVLADSRLLGALIFVATFFLLATATTEIYTLSLHDALPIFGIWSSTNSGTNWTQATATTGATWYSVASSSDGSNMVAAAVSGDRKSTRLNSSHDQISYAVFCLKKKNQKEHDDGHNAKERLQQ